MSLISIDDSSVDNDVVYYHIAIRLPLRSLSVQRRYSDFVQLVATLSAQIGIAPKDFPYELPPKSGLFARKERTVRERKEKLSSFLRSLVRDRDLQNRPAVHQFLQLPHNFKFTPELFNDVKTNSDDKFLIDDRPEDISKNQWLTYLRLLRSNAMSLSEEKNIDARMESRGRINKYIRPNLEVLAASLAVLSRNGDVNSGELKERSAMLTAVQNRVETVLGTGSAPAEEPKGFSRRTFGVSAESAVETKATMALSNKELLQQQQQVHKEQDEELEQLRYIIARQRQIGETINREVEEQNELLDRFNDEVDASSEKVKGARGRARQLG